MTFRPLPILTTFVLASLAILVWLGTWQMDRLEWKEALLADVDETAKAPALTSGREIDNYLKEEPLVSGRRVRLQGEFLPMDNGGFHLHVTHEGGPGWRRLTPFRLESTGRVYLVASAPFVDSLKDTKPMPPEGLVQVAGYLTPTREPGGFAVDSTPSANRWFHVDPYADNPETNWNELSGYSALYTDWWIDATVIGGGAASSDLPPRPEEMKNDHLGYAMTWYSLAVILLIIYLVYHAKAGRLSFGRKR